MYPPNGPTCRDGGKTTAVYPPKSSKIYGTPCPNSSPSPRLLWHIGTPRLRSAPSPPKYHLFSVKSMYRDIMQAVRLPEHSVLWKLRVPLKVKIFLWYLKKGVTLTKDNLLKRNWKGDSTCCFCSCKETIQHLFFECHVAKFVWGSVRMVFGIQPPSSVTNLLGSWLRSFSVKLRKQLLVGAVALCWAIWLCRNNAVFCQTTPNSYLQVIFRGTF